MASGGCRNEAMIVLDANILVRAVLGIKVASLLDRYALPVRTVAPDFAFTEARKALREIASLRGASSSQSLLVLDSLYELVEEVEFSLYAPFESAARLRIGRRDPDDWPVLAAALALGAPIWTEDLDFFGCGVATWTSDRVEIFLRERTAVDEAGE